MCQSLHTVQLAMCHCNIMLPLNSKVQAWLSAPYLWNSITIFLHDKGYMDWPRHKRRPSHWEATNCLSHVMAFGLWRKCNNIFRHYGIIEHVVGLFHFAGKLPVIVIKKWWKQAENYVRSSACQCKQPSK